MGFQLTEHHCEKAYVKTGMTDLSTFTLENFSKHIIKTCLKQMTVFCASIGREEEGRVT